MAMTAVLTTFINAGQEALILIGRAVLPVLFPFFVLTTLILHLVPTCNRLVLVGLAYLSGYPNGTRMTQNWYEQGYLDQTDAQHLAILTSTPSPIFVIATVGTIFLQNTRLGIIIFICAVGSAIINSWLWRPPLTNRVRLRPTLPPTRNFLTAFNDALRQATSAIINVCGIVLFFFVLSRLLHLPIFLTGLLEMTTAVAQTTNPLLIEFFVTFGGLSVAMQNLLFGNSFHLRFRHYCAYKFTQAIIACGLLACYLLFF